MHIKSFTFNAFAENTYLVYDDTKECIIIDPGCYEQSEKAALENFVRDNGLKVVKLLNTHGHVDHVLGNRFVGDTFDVDLFNHPKDLDTLRSVSVYAPAYGFHQYQELLPKGHFEEDDIIRFGKSELKVLFTPGHAPGHVVFYHEASQTCIGGDVLFHRSIGRYDLPGGDLPTLLQSIRSKLFNLPDSVTVYPGHGPATTIGEEKKYNPYLQQDFS
jgi:hydroxyacylglutathione hydrolase